MKWYEYLPSDTLFLRGAEPMVSGTSFETTQVFPPAVSVVSGAMRTAVLAQNKISIGQYKKGDPISEHIGAFGKKAPFKVLGPFIKYCSDHPTGTSHQLAPYPGIRGKRGHATSF